MKKMSFNKYKRYEAVNLPDRKWPSAVIEKAPIWCSVDLRDANQALPIPMNVEEKVEMFRLLTEIGFKNIEVGFPSASDTEYKFIRKLIEEKLIPDDVTIQVLVQARRHLIERTFESLKGVKRAVVHLYNSTSTLQRKVVFGKTQKEIIDIAIEGAKLVKEYTEKQNETEIILQYSPESFTGTELEYAKEICEAVMDIWQPTKEKKIILNLPATVEMSTPNVYADQIEWMCRNIKDRESVIISLHTHNDRGTSVAASELGLMAGADRIEGTLFGNGERTGNVDIVTIAMNMFSQGIDPELDFSEMKNIVEIYEKNMKMRIPERQPYAGELVYTAFSGSHQDAIRKGLTIYNDEKLEHWEVPYLPIDPFDVGMKYESIIRINSQSGKGGVAYIMEQDFGYKLPKTMHVEFGKIIKDESDRTGTEIQPGRIHDIFKAEYLDIEKPYKILKYEIEEKEELSNETEERVVIDAVVSINGIEKSFKAAGNGPIDAFFSGLKSLGAEEVKFLNYEEHALGEGSDSKAVSYIHLKNKKGNEYYGVGVARNVNTAAMKAILSALNRMDKYEG